MLCEHGEETLTQQGAALGLVSVGEERGWIDRFCDGKIGQGIAAELLTCQIDEDSIDEIEAVTPAAGKRKRVNFAAEELINKGRGDCTLANTGAGH